VRLKVLGKFKKSTSSGTRNGDLRACSTLARAPQLEKRFNSVTNDCQMYFGEFLGRIFGRTREF
jgi:hypothetical protein